MPDKEKKVQLKSSMVYLDSEGEGGMPRVSSKIDGV